MFHRELVILAIDITPCRSNFFSVKGKYLGQKNTSILDEFILRQNYWITLISHTIKACEKISDHYKTTIYR